MPTAQYGSLPFTEAIDFFRNKVNLPSERWADVWREQHNLAFMVAGAAKTELLADLRGMVDNAIANGQSLTAFQSQFKSLIKKHGWDHTGTAAWRANIIYSTNMRQSYNAGRHEQLQGFEYWRYKHGDSLSPRPHHQSKDGLILPKTSPFWQTWFPQNGWGCKCKVFGESQRSLKRKGLTPSKEPVIDTREWTDKVTGEVHHVPVGIDPGFDYAPGKVSQTGRLKEQLASKPPLAERLPQRLVPSAFSTVSGVEINGINRITDELLQSPAAPQIKQLVTFIQQRNIKTLIVKHAEMGKGKAAWAIAEDVGQYLGVSKYKARTYYAANKKDPPEGFTSISFDHVVIKATTKHNLKNVNIDAMLVGIKNILSQGIAGTGKYDYWGAHKRWYASSEATGSFYDDTSRYITWLHELGHQVHYKARLPAPHTQLYLTEYGNIKKPREWFAEHFVFWLLARDELASAWPQTALYFDDIMTEILK